MQFTNEPSFPLHLLQESILQNDSNIQNWLKWLKVTQNSSREADMGSPRQGFGDHLNLSVCRQDREDLAFSWNRKQVASQHGDNFPCGFWVPLSIRNIPRLMLPLVGNPLVEDGAIYGGWPPLLLVVPPCWCYDWGYPAATADLPWGGHHHHAALGHVTWRPPQWTAGVRGPTATTRWLPCVFGLGIIWDPAF